MNTNLARSRRGNAFAVPVSMQVCENPRAAALRLFGAGARLSFVLLRFVQLYFLHLYFLHLYFIHLYFLYLHILQLSF